MKCFSIWDQFRLPGDKLPDDRRVCVNRTPSHTACKDAHSVSAHTLKSMITFHHANTRGSRAHSSGLHALVSQNNCHPRVMSRSLPHLKLTTSTSSLSPISPIFQSFSPSHPIPLAHDPYTQNPCGFNGGVADRLKSHLPQVTSTK